MAPAYLKPPGRGLADALDGLADLLSANPAITAVRVPDTRGLPHWEKPAETFQALDHFWQTSRLFQE